MHKKEVQIVMPKRFYSAIELSIRVNWSQKHLRAGLAHNVRNTSEWNLKEQIEEYAMKQGVAFYPAGRGVGHQIMVGEGFTFPGT